MWQYADLTMEQLTILLAYWHIDTFAHCLAS